MKSRVLGCLLFIIFIASVAYGDTLLSPVTQDEKQAINNGCKVTRLKKGDANNCVLEKFDGHDLVLTIYDFAQGQYKKTDQFRITSWYNEAKVSYKDLLGRGTDFIIVEFEGNTGTGTLQKVLAVIGWNKGKFVPVLLEPLSYYVDNKGMLTDLKVNYEIAHNGSDGAAFNFKYTYSKESVQETYRRAWSDSLSWDEATFSFYRKTTEEQKISAASTPVQKKIITVRINTMKVLHDTSNLDLEFLRQLKIMDILE